MHFGDFSDPFPDNWGGSVHRWYLEGLRVPDIKDLVNVTAKKAHLSPFVTAEGAWRYFCGCRRNRVQDRAAEKRAHLLGGLTKAGGGQCGGGRLVAALGIRGEPPSQAHVDPASAPRTKSQPTTKPLTPLA